MNYENIVFSVCSMYFPNYAVTEMKYMCTNIKNWTLKVKNKNKQIF